MKHILTILVGAAVLVSTPAFAQGDKKCDQGLINKSIKHLHENIDQFPEGQQAIAKIQNSIDNGHLDPKNKDKAIQTYLEIAVRRANNCKISEQLQADAIELFNTNDQGTKDCRKDLFLDDANAEYAKLRELENFEEFEQMAKHRILQNMVPAVQIQFAQKWDASPALREKLIIASIQASKRKKDGCKNVALPVAPLITEFAQ